MTTPIPVTLKSAWHLKCLFVHTVHNIHLNQHQTSEQNKDCHKKHFVNVECWTSFNLYRRLYIQTTYKSIYNLWYHFWINNDQFYYESFEYTIFDVICMHWIDV